MLLCSVSLCLRPMYSRNLCSPHYHRLRKTGDVRANVPIRTRRKSEEECSIADCDRAHYGLGLCSRHYNRAHKKNDPEYIPTKTPREWVKFFIESGTFPDECVEWPYGKNDSKNYGGFITPYSRRAHASILWLTAGEPPEGKPYALHSCDNPPCVNPKHLRWGNHQENMDDAVFRDRFALGENAAHAKLSNADVLVIFNRFLKGEKVITIAADYPHVSYDTVYAVCRRRRRQNLTSSED